MAHYFILGKTQHVCNYPNFPRIKIDFREHLKIKTPPHTVPRQWGVAVFLELLKLATYAYWIWYIIGFIQVSVVIPHQDNSFLSACSYDNYEVKKQNPLVPIIRLISKAKLTCHPRGNCEPISFGKVTPYIFKNVILNSEVHF